MALEDPNVLSGAFWAELRVFLAVAKFKSFNRAGQMLNMSQPTVSRHVRRLQDVLGAQLIISTQTGVKLTPRGVDLARTLAELDRKLGAISDDLRLERSEAEGVVRVNTSEALAGLFIAPAVVDFTTRHPGIRLRFANPIRMTDVRENNTDILLNFSPGNAKGVATQACGTVHLIAVAHENYISRFGVPCEDTIAQHLIVDTSAFMGDAPLWQPWRSLVRRAAVVHSCDNPFAYALMVKSGLGIGLLASCALTDPNIVALNMGPHIRLPLYLHALSDRLESRPVRLVHDWLAGLFSPQAAWFGPDRTPSAHPPGAPALAGADRLSGR